MLEAALGQLPAVMDGDDDVHRRCHGKEGTILCAPADTIDWSGPGVGVRSELVSSSRLLANHVRVMHALRFLEKVRVSSVYDHASGAAQPLITLLIATHRDWSSSATPLGMTWFGKQTHQLVDGGFMWI